MESYDSQQELDLLFLSQGDSSQTSDKKFAQHWHINSTGAGKGILKHELYPPYPMPASHPPFFSLLWSSFGSILAGHEWWGGVRRGRAESLVPVFSRVSTGLTKLRGTGRIRNIKRSWAQANGLVGEAVIGVAVGLRTAPMGSHRLQEKGWPVLKSRLAS